MEAAVDALKRKLTVCVQRECERCKHDDTTLPDDCPYLILHVLDTREQDVAQMKRQCGKTSQLVALANELVQSKWPVYYWILTQQREHFLRSRHQIDSSIKVFSWGQIRTGSARGYSPGYILCDELQPHQVRDVRNTMIGSRLVAAYYT